jgi:hypothetical protein
MCVTRTILSALLHVCRSLCAGKNARATQML